MTRLLSRNGSIYHEMRVLCKIAQNKGFRRGRRPELFQEAIRLLLRYCRRG